MTNTASLNPHSSALVIIDMQHAYFNAGELARGRKTLTEHCNRLSTAFRNAHRPVIVIRTGHTRTPETWTLNMLADKKGYLFENTDEVEMVEGLMLQAEDSVVTKLRDSAFYATTLEQLLASKKVDTIVLAGVSTHSCIMLTAADAYARNIQVVLAEDAIDSHDKTFHEGALSLLAQEYRQPRMSTKEIETWVSS